MKQAKNSQTQPKSNSTPNVALYTDANVAKFTGGLNFAQIRQLNTQDSD